MTLCLPLPAMLCDTLLHKCVIGSVTIHHIYSLNKGKGSSPGMHLLVPANCKIITLPVHLFVVIWRHLGAHAQTALDELISNVTVKGRLGLHQNSLSDKERRKEPRSEEEEDFVSLGLHK